MPDPASLSVRPPAAPEVDEPTGAGGPAGVAVGRRLAFNAAAGGVANLCKIGIQLVMLPLMAHLLGPDEFGLFALALPTVAFFTSLADGGLGTALAREPQQTGVVWSTAFRLLLAVGLLLALLVAAWGMVLGSLAHDARVSGLMGLMALSLPLITLAVLPSARLTRQGRLAVLAGSDFAASLIGAAIAVLLALKGFGAWSLSAQYVTAFAVRAVILNVAAFVPPGRGFDFATLRPHLATGSSLISGRLAEFAGRMVENLLVGGAFGGALLGSYAFANQASRFMCEAASGPTWGALYTVALHSDQRRSANVHRLLLTVLAIGLAPLAALVAATAPVLVPLVLGAKWAAAAPLIQVILPALVVTVMAWQCAAPLLALGESWLPLWFAVAMAVLRIVAVGAGALVSPLVMVGGLALAQVVVSTALMAVTRVRLGPGFDPPFGSLWAPVLAAVLAGLAAHGLLPMAEATVPALLLALSGGAVVYLLALALLDGRRLLAAGRQARGLLR